MKLAQLLLAQAIRVFVGVSRMASMAAANENDSDAAEDDDECEGVAYMFDAAAATERRSLALDHGAVYYYCLADDDASNTHHISGHSAWPAA